jgi:hypothetical protein
MKKFVILFACLFASLVNGDSDTFSRKRLEGFYNGFLCEEKQELADAGLTSSCSDEFPPGDPSPPPFVQGYLPIVLVNRSGQPDSEIFIVVTGKTTDASSQVFLQINSSTGIASLHDVQNGDNSTSYSYALSSLPNTSGGHVIYVPQMISGIVWFSVQNKLSMAVSGGSIVQPNFTNPSDPNYYTNFDIFEFTYLQSGSPQIAADATAVSFFSIPLYGYLAGATSPSSHTGLFQSRSSIMSQASATLNTAVLPERTQWQNLFLQSGGTILRYLSPGKAMSVPLMDQIYLDNTMAYGYSYIEDIWTGMNAYYKTTGQNKTLDITVTITEPTIQAGTYNYKGQVDAMNQFVFVNGSGPAGPIPTPLPAPSTMSTPPTSTTTYNIFSALEFYPTKPTAGTVDDAVSKLIQEAIIAGLIPTTNTLSLDYLANNQGNFYTVNSNLTAAGQATGPWYDLYSKSLHQIGLIYTYGFDEPLWPQVLLGGPFVDNFTYLGITIGPLN